MDTKYARRVLQPDPKKIILFLAFVLAFVPLLGFTDNMVGSLLVFLISPKTIEVYYPAGMVLGSIASYLIACLIMNLFYEIKK